MSSILLSTFTLLSLPPQFTPPLSTLLTSTSTTSNLTPTTSNITISTLITSFIELRSQYIGVIDTTPNNNNNTNNHTNNTTTNNFSTNDDVFNYSLFHAALLTNSPIIIDAVLPYINYDFTTLNIPHDQIDRIKQSNTCNPCTDIFPDNFILGAIIDATEQGHYQSIQHLINNYQLSPTIPIFHIDHCQTCGFTNLLYYSATNKINPQLIKYLFPLCSKFTNEKVISRLILNIAKGGHFHLIKQLHNEYNVNLSQPQDEENGQNILYYAVKSNNIELIDYLIEDIGLSVNQGGILQSAIEAHKWDNVKHLITKHNADVELVNNALNIAARDSNITPDMIDYITTTFNITEDEINDTSSDDSPLFSFARNCNKVVLTHLIEKYNINPHCLFNKHNGKGDSLLHAALDLPSQIKSIQLLETVTYLLCELGLHVNQIGNHSKTPIELLVGSCNESKECRLPIFKLLLEHKALIGDTTRFIKSALTYCHFSIVQYFIETHQPPIDLNNIELSDEIPLLHAIIDEYPSVEFIGYLLSLNTIDINQKDDEDKTPIQYAMSSVCFNFDFIKLFVENGANVTIDDWLSMFREPSYYCNAYQFFQCLDYFKDTFGFSIETFSPEEHYQSFTTPLLQFSLHCLKFRYSTIKHDEQSFNSVIIYCALIHHYKANVNDQDSTNKNNTVFHNLATYNQHQLLQFTLTHSHYKPNLYLVNNKGHTFLHILVSKCDKWVVDVDDQFRREDDQISALSKLGERPDIIGFKFIVTDDERSDRYDNLAKVLDCVIDVL